MVDTTAPLARMWRSVYQKASEAAAARMGDLLRDHVYLFHRNLPASGGGGGGGGMVELGRAVATTGQEDLRVPASGALPTGYSTLWLAASGLNAHATPETNRDAFLFFNDEVETAAYLYRFVQGTTTNTVVAGGSGVGGKVNVGPTPSYDAEAPQGIWSLSGTLPLHEQAARPHAGQFLTTAMRSAFEGPLTRTTSGVYAPDPAAPITSVALRCTFPYWRAGATLIVYGCPNPA